MEKLELNSVQATMLLPLWGRAKYSVLNPELLIDNEATEVIKNINYDFSDIEKYFGEFGGLCYVVRARAIDNKVKEYIAKHPYATVVNIGAGLDTGFSRVDNGTIRWYNLDLPDAVEFRKTYIPDSERNISISKSLMDFSWFDDIEFSPDKGIIFISGGVFYYLHEKDVREAFAAMAARFPKGEIFFDAESKKAVDISNKMVRKTGNTGAMMYFYVNNGKKIKSWSEKISDVTCLNYFNIPDKSKWGAIIRFRIFMIEFFKFMKYVHVKFA